MEVCEVILDLDLRRNFFVLGCVPRYVLDLRAQRLENERVTQLLQEELQDEAAEDAANAAAAAADSSGSAAQQEQAASSEGDAAGSVAGAGGAMQASADGEDISLTRGGRVGRQY